MWEQLSQEQRWGFMYAAQLKRTYNATFDNEETHPTDITGQDIALAKLAEVGNQLWQEVLAEKTRRMAVAYQSTTQQNQATIQSILQVPDVIEE